MRAESANRPDPEVAAGLAVALLLAYVEQECGAPRNRGFGGVPKGIRTPVAAVKGQYELSHINGLV
jgi:hypothetical protein